MSRRRLTLTARARTDLAHIRLWYAKIRPELAEQFLDDIDIPRDQLVQGRKVCRDDSAEDLCES